MKTSSSYYYQLNGQSSREIGQHAGLIHLKKLCATAQKVLDVGCGEGSRLNTMLPKNRKGWGIDLSPDGIAQAKKQYPQYTFAVADASKIPHPDNYFNLVYTAYVLEHTQNPQSVIDEMLRVCQPGGRIVILCPNFGAPNRRSPRSVENPFIKLWRGLLAEYSDQGPDKWQKVSPAPKFEKPDDDTTVEPYLHSLVTYLKSKNLTLEVVSSLWSQEIPSSHPRKLLFKLLGQLNIPPFNYWGPQIFVVAKK